MSNYTKTTDFEAKDSLPSGDSGKIIRGSEFETEFDNIATAIATKADAASPTFTGTVTIDGLTVNGNTTLGNAATDTVTVTADIASNLIPSADDTYNLGASGAEWNDLFIDGTANIDSLVADTADIDGGTIDGVTIGGSSAGAITGTTITGTGFVTSGDMTFGDNDKAIFGAGPDLRIYHDGSNSYINDTTGTGNLYIASNQLIINNAANSENMARFAENGAATLYYDGSAKLATTSTGIAVTGNATFDDNGKAIFGAGSDLQIYHDGTQSLIRDLGTGNLVITANDFRLNNSTSNENMVTANQDGAVTLYYDGTSKLATTSTGVNVTGTVTADGVNTDYTNGFKIFDGSELEASWTHVNTTGTSTLNVGRNATWGGELIVQTDTKNRANFASNGDISFYEDTGTTAKLLWDASQERLEIDTNTAKALILERDGGTDANVSIEFNCATNDWYVGTNPANNFAIGTSLDQTNAPFQIDSSGRVEVSNAASAVLRLSTSDTSVADNQELGALEYSQADISGAGGGVKASIRAKADNSTAAQTYLAFHTSDSSTNDVERVRIDNAGNVGIGTTSPSTHLDVTGGTTNQVGIFRSSDTTATIGFADDTTPLTGNLSYVTLGAVGNNMVFNTNLVEAMRIDSSGNVAIGTTSASSALDVRKGSAGDQVARFKNTAGFGLIVTPQVGGSGAITDIGVASGEGLSFTTNNTESMRIESSGRVGIGDSAPDQALTVNGTIQAKNDSATELAASASGTVITPPRGYSYINVSRSDTTAYGLLLLVFRTSSVLTIVSTVDDRSASKYSASVSGTGLVITNDDSSTKSFYASCVCIAFGTGD